jgi:hypothetical protein
LLAFVEDTGAIDGQGGVEYRRNFLKRYELSSLFGRMILILTWAWGLGFIIVTIVSRVLIMLLGEILDLVLAGFAMGLFSGLLNLEVIFVRKPLDKERAEWRAEGWGASGQDSVD